MWMTFNIIFQWKSLKSKSLIALKWTPTVGKTAFQDVGMLYNGLKCQTTLQIWITVFKRQLKCNVQMATSTGTEDQFAL